MVWAVVQRFGPPTGARLSWIQEAALLNSLWLMYCKGLVAHWPVAAELGAVECSRYMALTGISAVFRPAFFLVGHFDFSKLDVGHDPGTILHCLDMKQCVASVSGVWKCVSFGLGGLQVVPYEKLRGICGYGSYILPHCGRSLGHFWTFPNVQ